MYNRWFSAEELRDLPFAAHDEERSLVWANMVAEAKALMAQGCPVDDEKAMDLATRWMTRTEEDTARRPEFLTRLNEMHWLSRKCVNRPELMMRQLISSPAVSAKANWLSGSAI